MLPRALTCARQPPVQPASHQVASGEAVTRVSRNSRPSMAPETVFLGRSGRRHRSPRWITDGTAPPRVTVETDGTVRWPGGAARRAEGATDGEGNRLACCVRVKRRSRGRVVAELTMWRSSRMPLSAAREASLRPVQGCPPGPTSASSEARARRFRARCSRSEGEPPVATDISRTGREFATAASCRTRSPRIGAEGSRESTGRCAGC